MATATPPADKAGVYALRAGGINAVCITGLSIKADRDFAGRKPAGTHDIISIFFFCSCRI